MTVAFFVKYWVEVLFSIVVAGGGLFFKRYWKLSKAEHQKERKELLDKVKTDVSEEIAKANEASEAGDKALQAEIDGVKDSMDVLKQGLLSIQGKQFRQECYYLLQEDHVITLDEYQDIDEEHETYNKLGGNHKGDHLFELVKQKATNTLAEK